MPQFLLNSSISVNRFFSFQFQFSTKETTVQFSFKTYTTLQFQFSLYTPFLATYCAKKMNSFLKGNNLYDIFFLLSFFSLFWFQNTCFGRQNKLITMTVCSHTVVSYFIRSRFQTSQNDFGSLCPNALVIRYSKIKEINGYNIEHPL